MVSRKNNKEMFLTDMKRKLKAVDDHCKVVWTYNGLIQDIPEMYDKPIALCRWWAKEHRRDSQYACGILKTVSMYTNTFRTS